MKFELIDEWKKALSMYSVWAFIALGLAPEIYNLAVQFGMLTGDSAPAALSRIINTIAFAGAVLRLVKQKKLEMDSEKPVENESQT